MSPASPFEGIGVGTVVQVLQGLGIQRSFVDGVAPRTGVEAFAGPARTLRCLPMREDLVEQRRSRPKSEDPHRVALEEVSPGEVVVIEARRNMRGAVAGDLLAERVRAAGGAAIVTDGCVRDAAGMRSVELAVFSAGWHASTFPIVHVGLSVDVPIACGDVAVYPGDHVVGDPEGVVVVPAALVDDVAERARYQEDRDEFLRARIATGTPLSEAYPPSAALLEEFEQARTAESVRD